MVNPDQQGTSSWSTLIAQSSAVFRPGKSPCQEITSCEEAMCDARPDLGLQYKYLTNARGSVL